MGMGLLHYSGECRNCKKQFKGRFKYYCSTECNIEFASKKHLLKDKEIKEKLICSLDDTIDIDKPLEIEAEFVLVAGDWHVPIHDVYWVTRILEVAAAIRTIYPKAKIILHINGDFIDFEKISAHNSINKQLTVRASIKQAAELLDVLITQFDEIYFTQGNHDWRFEKQMGHIGFEELVTLVKDQMEYGVRDQIIASRKNFLYINDDWLAAHPYKYSKIPTRLAVQFAQRHKRHTILAHQHHPPGFASCENNEYFGIDGGCMINVGKAQYVQDNINLFPNMGRGFVMLHRDKKGTTRFRLYSDRLTDWDFEMAMLKGVFNASEN